MNKTTKMSFRVTFESGKRKPLKINVKPAGSGYPPPDMNATIYVKGLPYTRERILSYIQISMGYLNEKLSDIEYMETGD